MCVADSAGKSAFEADPIVMHARLTVIFRDLAWNASVRTVDGLKTSIHDGLRDNVPNIPAVVKIGEWDHFFTGVNKEGRAVTLLCWPGATIKPWQWLSILHSTPYMVACDGYRTRLDGGDSRASAQRQGTRLAAASISSIDAMISSKLGAAPKIMEIVLA
jgi:hypothetical protein